MRLSWNNYHLYVVVAVLIVAEAGVCLAGDSLTLELVPISASSGAAAISGNSITVNNGGITIELALYVSGWGAVGDGNVINVTAKVDGFSYCGGAGQPIAPLGYPANPLRDCAMNAGLGCPSDGDMCDLGAFLPDKTCSINQRVCSVSLPCDSATEGVCVDNPDFIFSGMNPTTALQYGGLDYIFSTFISRVDGPIDVGQSALFGTLIISVPLDADGTYSIDFDTGIDNAPFSSLTGIFDGLFVFHPFEMIIPAKIIVGVATGGNGDFNGDRRVDLLDAQRFQRCYTSSDVNFESGCQAGDIDNDGDIDLGDYVEFVELIQ